MYSYFFYKFLSYEIVQSNKLLKNLHFTVNLFDFFASSKEFLTVDYLELEKITLYYSTQKLFRNIKSFIHIHKVTIDLHKHNKFVYKAILKFEGFQIQFIPFF